MLSYLFGDAFGQRRYKSTQRKRRLWLDGLVIIVLIWALFYSWPNLYPDRDALHLSPSRTQVILDNDFRDGIRELLAQNNVTHEYAGRLRVGGSDVRVFEIRFYDQDERARARALLNDWLEEKYADDYVMSYNRVRTANQFIRLAGGVALNLGLDLQGGVHFLMEVDTLAAIRQRIDATAGEFKVELGRNRLRSVYFSTGVTEKVDGVDYPAIGIGFISDSVRSQAIQLFSEYEMQAKTREEGGIYYVNFYFSEVFVEQVRDFAISQNMATLRERINELGVTSPLVQRQGSNRIIVEMPGVSDAAAAKRVIGSTANLEFRMEASRSGTSAGTPFPFRDNPRERAYLDRKIIVGGENVINAQAQFDETGVPQVAITLDSRGGRNMNRVTREAVGQNMAVLLVETNVKNFVKNEADGSTEFETETKKQIISIPTIRDVLGSRFVITGLYDQAEASELALLLRAGALAAPMYFVEEKTIGASLGQDNIRKGVFSLILGSLCVILFILFYYRVFGLIANLGLMFNLILIVAIMSQLSAVLTLPGIAGIVLTIGMAIDANILIFSRIKEEMRKGLSGIMAIDAGYNRALLSIIDANITTLLVGIILFSVGTGPIKGFAITLSIGILTSLFTSIIFTRRILEFLYAKKLLKKIYI
ncbi:MAG: protein translocase subunit SecD [Candidatus Portiera sp.]|nr:protein translocase subunit SecD [Portiera sp.]